MLHDDGDFVSPAPQMSFYYKTRDLYEAAVIHSFQYPVIDVQREPDGTCYFTFEDRKECEKMVREFRNRNLMVNARAFIESIRAMKDFIYDNQRKDKNDGRD